MKVKGRLETDTKNFVVFFLLWIILTEGDMHQVWLGFAFVLLAVISASWIAKSKESRTRFHLRALMAYFAYFIYHSLTGGIDVAYRAFRLNKKVRPTYVRYPLRIPSSSENARILFALSICLFPGSLSCAFRENILIIQVLDEELAKLTSLERLEELVARLFSIPLPPAARKVGEESR